MSLQCNLYDAVSLEDAQSLIKKYAEANPPNEREWIVGKYPFYSKIIGAGYRKTWFPNGIALASKLDEIIPDR